MAHSRLAQIVCRRVHCVDVGVAEQLVDATLRTLALGLEPLSREPIARRLEPPHDAAFGLRRQAEELDREMFMARIHASLPGEIEITWEHLTVVCQVLTEALDDVGRAHLRRHLPALRDLFEARPPPPARLRSDPHYVSHAHGPNGHTLSSGAAPHSDRRTTGGRER